MLVFLLFFIVGLIIMFKHKFYHYSTNDMLFATKFKIFLSGLLASLIGVYGLFKLFIE